MLFRSLLVIAFGLQSCVYTQSVTQTNVPLERSRKVEASIERWVFFATFDSDELNRIPAELQKKCPGGKVNGVYAKELRRLFFFALIMKREVHVEGYCQNGESAKLPESDQKIIAEVMP
jgi:hypothetical protein